MPPGADPGPALRLEGVRRTFRTGKRVVTALDGITASAAPGGTTGLIGPDGAGKTTLMRLIAGLLRADAGRIEVLGLDVARNPLAVQGRLGYMPQHFGLYDDLSVQENLELGLNGSSRNDRRPRVAEMYETFPMLHDKRRQLAGNLSGGEQQILEMAMVLEARPRVLLIDEPSLGLSPHAQDEIFEIVRGVADRGTPVVLAEQNVLRAARKSDRAVILIGGCLGADVDAADIVAGTVDLHEAFLGRSASGGVNRSARAE